MAEINWDSITEVAFYCHYWADRTFPGRIPERALSKLVMEEIPELLQHKAKHGTIDIAGELADCFVLLMDLAVCWDVQLHKAIRDKMQINERRMWTKDEATGHYHHGINHPPLEQRGYKFPMTGAYAPEATCRHGVHPFSCKQGCDPHQMLDSEGGHCD